MNEEYLKSPERIDYKNKMVTKAFAASLIVFAVIAGLLMGGGLIAILQGWTSLTVIPAMGVVLLIIGAAVFIYARTRL